MQTESTNAPEPKPRVVPLLGPSEHTDISQTPGQDDFNLRVPLPALTYHESLQANPTNIQVRFSNGSTSHPILRRVGNGTLEATEEVNVPEGGISKAIYHIKHVLIGAPISKSLFEKVKKQPTCEPSNESKRYTSWLHYSEEVPHSLCPNDDIE